MAKTNHKWTVEDEQKLTNCSDDFRKTAKELQRTVDAVQCRFTKLYICPRMREMFYDKTGNKIDVDCLKVHFDNFIIKYALFYKIEKNDLVRFLSYSDKNLKTTLSTIRTLDDITDSDSDTDSDDKSYMQSLQNLDKWKLKYYRLKYAIRIKMINDMLCKHC
jgi:hypothetical protein